MRKILTHGQISGLTDRSIEGKKTWDDSNNADRLRPVSIQVRLLADGAAYDDVITLSDGNNWRYTWSDLPAKKNGQYISYTVQDITNVNGYTVSISESGTGFTESFLNMQSDLYLSCDRRQFCDTIYYRFRTDKQGYLWVDQGSEE